MLHFSSGHIVNTHSAPSFSLETRQPVKQSRQSVCPQSSISTQSSVSSQQQGQQSGLFGLGAPSSNLNKVVVIQESFRNLSFTTEVFHLNLTSKAPASDAEIPRSFTTQLILVSCSYKICSQLIDYQILFIRSGLVIMMSGSLLNSLLRLGTRSISASQSPQPSSCPSTCSS